MSFDNKVYDKYEKELNESKVPKDIEIQVEESPIVVEEPEPEPPLVVEVEEKIPKKKRVSKKKA